MKHKFSFRKKILMAFCVVMVIGFLTNRQILRTTTHSHFNKNELLDKEEKGYAKRCYGYLIERPDTSSMPPDISKYDFNSDIYRKWGLGKRRVFIKPEKRYILKTEDIDIMWKIYKDVDLNNLNDLEKNFLNKIHNLYGPGSLQQKDLLKFIRESEGDFFDADVATYEYMLGYLSVIFDFNEIDDHIVIFMHRLGPVAVF
jgi:hypothetical protein